MKTLSDSHTESDQVLLYGPAAFLANTARILDDFGATQSNPAFIDPDIDLSDVTKDLPSARDKSTAAPRHHKTSNTDIGVDHSEEKVAAGGFGRDRRQQHQYLPPSLRSEGLF